MKAWQIPLFLYSLSTLAGTNSHLERINFFPKSNAYLNMGIQNLRTNIVTPKSTIDKAKVNNFSNLIQAEYAHKIHKQIFLGLKGIFEETSENAASYGIPIQGRFQNTGPQEPALFMLTRLREQKENIGLIDFSLSYTDAWGARSIGYKNGKNFIGKNILSTSLSHGLVEEEWEFKSGITFTYHDEGEEKNRFTNKSYDIDASVDFEFNFTTQYQLDPKHLIWGGIGFDYSGTEVIDDREGDKRELQAGTGSVFKLGLKRILSEHSLISIQSGYWRNEYFVKGITSNLDGTRQVIQIGLNYLRSF